MKLKKIIKAIGMILTLLSLVLVGMEICKMDLDLRLLSGSKIWIFILFTVIYTGLVTVLGIPWGMYVKAITGVEIPFRKLNLTFTKSNLMKYIPGNVFQYIGRNEIAVDYKLDHKDVACATVMDVISLAFSGALVAFVFSAKGLWKWLLQYISVPMLSVLLVMGIICFIVLLFLLKKIKYFSFLFQKKTLVALLKGIFLLMIFHICSAVMFCIVMTNVLEIQLGEMGIATVIGAWCIGYLAGYIIPGAPGGLGVREITISFLLAAVVDAPMVALGTVFMRVSNILGEVLAFVCALLGNLGKGKAINGSKDR